MSKSNYDDSDIISMIKKQKLKEMGNQILEFIDFVDRFLFIEGCTDEEYQNIIKRAKRTAKRLKKGKDLDKVFDVERLEECAQEDPSFAREYLNDYY